MEIIEVNYYVFLHKYNYIHNIHVILLKKNLFILKIANIKTQKYYYRIIILK